MNKVIEAISILAVAGTIIASFYIYNFYQSVNINIFNYLDASEILTSQFQLLIKFGLIVIQSFILVIIPISVIAHFFAPKEVELEINNEESFENEEDKITIATKAAKKSTLDWLNFPVMNLDWIIVIVILGWLSVIILTFYSPVKFPFVKIFTITATAAAAVILFNRFVSKSLFNLYRGKYFSNRPLANEAEKMIKILIAIESIAGILAFTNLIAQYNIQDIMIISTRNNVTLELDNKIIKTNDTLIYLGRTRNFIFLFHKYKEEAQVISSDKINRFTLSAGSKSKIIPPSYVNSLYFKRK